MMETLVIRQNGSGNIAKGSIWVNYEKISHAYDGNNNLIEELWQGWDGSDWENLGQVSTHI